MINRKTLTALAIGTLVLFGIAAAVGNHHHGLRQVVADISWNGFLLGLLLTIVASVVVIVRSSRAKTRRAT
jgi:hypothetical protein